VTSPLAVAIVGCGRIGRVRAAALRPADRLVACADVDLAVAEALGREYGAPSCRNVDEALEHDPGVVIVATSHDQLAPIAERALEAGAHVLVEKPAGIGTADVERLRSASERAGCIVKVGFNHRFHPGLFRAAAEVRSGRHGELLHVRGRYGHGGRPGYDREWRTSPELSGGGELVDQGMHLLDLVHWLAGPLPLHSALLRTQFWDTAVEDNAALILGPADDRTAPWAILHVSWTEWKNTFSLEIYCRSSKLQVDGLGRSYGPETLRIYRMKPELGPPELEEIVFPNADTSWLAEWEHFTAVLDGKAELLGSLADSHYAWSRVEDAYATSPYAAIRPTRVHPA
jgi:predicted dehydrogenase